MPTYESWTVRREAWLPPFPLAVGYEHDCEGRPIRAVSPPGNGGGPLADLTFPDAW